MNEFSWKWAFNRCWYVCSAWIVIQWSYIAACFCQLSLLVCFLSLSALVSLRILCHDIDQPVADNIANRDADEKKIIVDNSKQSAHFTSLSARQPGWADTQSTRLCTTSRHHFLTTLSLCSMGWWELKFRYWSVWVGFL